MRHETGPSHGSTKSVGLWSLEVTDPRSKMSVLGGIDWGCIKNAEVTVIGTLKWLMSVQEGDPSRAGSLPMGYSLLDILTETFRLVAASPEHQQAYPAGLRLRIPGQPLEVL